MIAQKTQGNSLIVDMLNKIAEIEAERDDIEMTHPLSGRINQLLGEAAALERQLAEITMPLDSQIAGLKAAVIEETLKVGGSVKGIAYQAVYMKGRESVDTKLFKGLLLAHPEYQPMLHVGEPSVSIRPVKKEA